MVYRRNDIPCYRDNDIPCYRYIVNGREGLSVEQLGQEATVGAEQGMCVDARRISHLKVRMSRSTVKLVHRAFNCCVTCRMGTLGVYVCR